MTTADVGRLEFALDAARKASEFILGYYQSASLAVERKRDSSPVTEADRGAEQLLRKLIGREYPEDGILGEEFGDTPGTSGYRWIVDPVDGTKSFIYGVPLFGTLIGVEHNGVCEIGVNRFPALDEVVYAEVGKGAWWQKGTAAPQPARVSVVSEFKQACFTCTTFTGWATIGRTATFERLCSGAGLVRAWGDCYGHALVATGRADVMIDTGMNPWDAAPMIPIMQEAGGAFLDWKGQSSIYSGNGLSVNAALRDTVLAMLRE